MVLARAAVTVALAFGLAAACADDAPQRAEPPAVTTATTTAVVTATPATTAPIATDLAPSQVTASTVAPPAGAPPCVVDDLEFTAGGVGIVAIRNTGPVECEVDVSKSPNRDPLMEPGVWLHSGGEAELAVEPNDEGCAQPSTIESVDLVVNDEPVTAPVALADSCRATLVAIYTAD